jgi:hypothetical protein
MVVVVVVVVVDAPRSVDFGVVNDLEVLNGLV